jgi:hypothetical protein
MTSQIDKIKLVEKHGRPGQYVALSHSWGSSPMMVTTSETYRAHLQGIMISELPRTFRDAVIITERLKVRYLWIDSLCIIEGNSADWERESTRMGSVYSNSYLTIAASGSIDSSSGCFQPQSVSIKVPSDCRSTGFAESRFIAVQVQLEVGGLEAQQINVSKEWMPASLRQRPRAYEIGSFGAYFDPIGEQPLSSRAWTLQERYLSPRVLHYATDQLYIQCKAGIFAQDGAYFHNFFNISSVINSETAKNMQSSERHIISNMPGLAPDGLRESSTNHQKVVEQYSRKNLSYESDKLPALSGLANEIARYTGNTYLAGLWKTTILEGVLWRVYLREELSIPYNKSSSPTSEVSFGRKLSNFRYPSAYRAPSWSWASVDASIHFEHLKSRLVVARYIDSYLELASEDIYGGLKSGWLSIRACLASYFFLSVSTAVSLFVQVYS